MTAATISLFQLDHRLTFLSRLLFSGSRSNGLPPETFSAWREGLETSTLSREEFDGALTFADSNHVTMRTIEIFRQAMIAGNDCNRAQWAQDALQREAARIANALSFLCAICDALDSEGCDVVVIKSLDHWPDLGSDLDLYTDAEPAAVIRVMRDRFQAQVAARSWGDRLANKWNFIVPGLPESVEVHVRRLGQTGEQVALARSLCARARAVKIGEYRFQVPSAEHRLMISTLQRMYRHFYIRLCDIVDTAELVQQKIIAYDALHSAASAGGIWEGVATYLSLVSEYVRSYRGEGLDLPPSVMRSASFGADSIRFGRGFLRVPILPHSARLYRSEFASLLRRGELRNTARLSLLPGLATAAAVGMKVTGSDKGIW
jgi:Uncharacterised nucleotidyltransferase